MANIEVQMCDGSFWLIENVDPTELIRMTNPTDFVKAKPLIDGFPVDDGATFVQWRNVLAVQIKG